MKEWKGRAPKKRRRKDIEAAIKMIVYPPIIFGVVLFSSNKNKRKEKGKKK